jgi:hypothetical protein
MWSNLGKLACFANPTALISNFALAMWQTALAGGMLMLRSAAALE